MCLHSPTFGDPALAPCALVCGCPGCWCLKVCAWRIPWLLGGAYRRGVALALPPLSRPDCRPYGARLCKRLDAQRKRGIAACGVAPRMAVQKNEVKTLKAKTYPVEKIGVVAKALAEAPTLPPKFKGHNEALADLTKQIKELHDKKNYDIRQLTQLLKQNGIKTTQKEVKELLEK